MRFICMQTGSRPPRGSVHTPLLSELHSVRFGDSPLYNLEALWGGIWGELQLNIQKWQSVVQVLSAIYFLVHFWVFQKCYVSGA